jgi:ADP-ribose pyrophosphatase YjhB (NUDIX family)
MQFSQKIYFNDKPLVLTDDTTTYIAENPVAAGYLALSGNDMTVFQTAFEHLGKDNSIGAIVTAPSHQALLATLRKLYEPVGAAGGIVQSENGKVLLIFRRGKWDLPKGKIDRGEAVSDCALREVKEETGIQDISLGDRVCDTWHVYSMHGKNLLKHTTWFSMYGSENQTLMPQAEENIEEVRWVAITELPQYYNKAYQAIREVLSYVTLH